MKIYSFLIVLFICFSCGELATTTSETYNFCRDTIHDASKNGFTKNYFENSINIKSIGLYKNGLHDGFWKYFYRNGNMKSEGEYKDGQKQGFWKEYYKNGSLKTEGHIRNCKPTGYWRFYDQKSNLIKEKNY